jgi:cytochrome c556
MMKKLTWVAAMLVAVWVAAAAGAAHAQGIDPIETRQTGLDLLAGTFAGVKAVVTTNGDVKTLEGPGKAIERWGKLFPTLFPAGSDKGKTKASPDIWTDNATFQKDAMALSTAGEALATAAKAGDATAVNAAFKEIGDACGACHKAFRLK